MEAPIYWGLFGWIKKVACPLFLSVAICVFSASSAYSQETSALSAVTKTKIKEWFDILTIPSEVEGLKHKDPTVRISAIQSSITIVVAELALLKDLWKIEKEG